MKNYHNASNKNNRIIITTICVNSEADTVLRKSEFIENYYSRGEHYPDKNLAMPEKEEIRGEILIGAEDQAKGL